MTNAKTSSGDRGQVFGCTKNHATCFLCCGVDIESGVDEDVDVNGQDEEGMEVDKQDEKADENKFDDMVCTMEDCKSKTSINCLGKKLTGIVGDLRLKVPCKNRDDGCPHKCVEDEMEEHEDECGDRKVECDYLCRKIPFKDLLDHYRDEHNWDYETKKWFMMGKYKPTEKGEPVRYKAAFMFETGPDGLIFITDINQDKGFFGIAALWAESKLLRSTELN